MKAGSRGRAERDISASPNTLYDLVADINRMGDWSPECTRCVWIDGANGPSVGARFRGTNRHGLARWSTTLSVVVASRGREFGFVTTHRGKEMTRWTYRFTPSVTGTKVEESFELLCDMPWYFRLSDRFLMGVQDRHGDLERNMAETLERLAALTVAGCGSGDRVVRGGGRGVARHGPE